MQTIIGVLRGGPSREHDVSLKTGAAMLANLPEDRYIVRDIYIDRKGVWHDRGRVVQPERILRQVDVVLIGLHGEYGEDGKVQRLLEQFSVPYAGTDSFGSHLSMHKLMSKMRIKEAGLLVPDFEYVERPEDSESVVHRVIRKFSQPVIVKPVGWGSSVGISLVGGYAPVLSAVNQLLADGASSVLIEEYVRGREATVGVIEDFRGEKLYSLPVVEIVPPPGASFFSEGVKYTGETREICPGNFSRVISEELQRAAKVAHRALGSQHYSRSDFMVSPKGVYYLETNTLPGLTSESLMPKSLQSVGVAFSDFLTHLVNLALAR